ncbi:hypothetical protein SO802_022774 [Lithocarpus litseifolius]|uniref:Uncharacterized protein n=1 Tax=Lithocarpus litseifolius TaxID=425828 RepID=A0AAW2C5V6_9ROSI
MKVCWSAYGLFEANLSTQFMAGHTPKEVVIFIVGGTTYEESRSVALQNASNSGIRFILGGSVVLNSKRAFDLVIGSGKIVNEYWVEELDDHQNQPTFLA